MVKVEFVDGTEETVEPKKTYREIRYSDMEEAYIIRGVGEEVHYPREFVKSIRYIEV